MPQFNVQMRRFSPDRGSDPGVKVEHAIVSVEADNEVHARELAHGRLEPQAGRTSTDIDWQPSDLHLRKHGDGFAHVVATQATTPKSGAFVPSSAAAGGARHGQSPIVRGVDPVPPKTEAGAKPILSLNRDTDVPIQLDGESDEDYQARLERTTGQTDVGGDPTGGVQKQPATGAKGRGKAKVDDKSYMKQLPGESNEDFEKRKAASA